jgi:signal transduction histidine kinase
VRVFTPAPSGMSARDTHKLMGRGISAFALLLLLQASGEIMTQMLWTAGWWEATFLWGFLGVLVVFVVASFRGHGLTWSAAMLSALVLLGLMLWPAAVPADVPGTIGTPWLWAMINVGAVWCAFAFGTIAGCVYTVLIGGVFAVVRTLPQGASAAWQVALQDASFATVLGLIICLTIGILRSAARRVDTAAESAIRSYREAAAETALSNERLRLDALLHDSVMTALITGAHAASPRERLSSAELAVSALQRLEDQGSKTEEAAPATVAELAARIQFTVGEGVGHPELFISHDSREPLFLQGEVVRAVFEATTEAVNNAVRHSGATRCEVRVTCHRSGDSARLTVSVKDNGVGFNRDVVSDRRLGIKVSIIGRMEAVGGAASVTSAAGAGTEVRLTWTGAEA